MLMDKSPPRDTNPNLPIPIPSDARARWALFLDVDGTLVDIAPEPDAVVVTPRLIAVLGRLHDALGGAVALVSGRTVARLDALFAPLRLPAAGNHGLERRGADGLVHRPPVRAAEIARLRAAFADFAAARPGTIVEDKGLSIALHFRLAPSCGDEAVALANRLAGEIGGGFRVQHGKMMVEVRPDGGTKGSVVDGFMTEPPFAGRVPVFVGDDVTDEDGFAAANRRNGLSMRVGGDEPTGARYRVASVAALLDWLEALAGGAENAGMRRSFC